MALDKDRLKAKMKLKLFEAFQREFADVKKEKPDVEQQWKKMAEAISDIAVNIVEEIVNFADVMPGIDTQDNGVTVPMPGPVLHTHPVSISGKTVSKGKVN